MSEIQTSNEARFDDWRREISQFVTDFLGRIESLKSQHEEVPRSTAENFEPNSIASRHQAEMNDSAPTGEEGVDRIQALKEQLARRLRQAERAATQREQTR